MHALPSASPKSSKEDDATRWPDHRKTPTTTVSRRSCRTGSCVDAAASTTTTKQSSRRWRASPSSASTSSWRSPGPTHGDHRPADLAAKPPPGEVPRARSPDVVDDPSKLMPLSPATYSTKSRTPSSASTTTLLTPAASMLFPVSSYILHSSLV